MTRKKYTQQVQKKFLPNAEFTFNDTAVILFRSNLMNYQFIQELNKAYRIDLARVDDIDLNYSLYPCFSYNDKYAHIAYVMIERSASESKDPIFDYYDKMLLVRGRDSWKKVQLIYSNTVEGAPEPDAADLLEHRRWVLANIFKQSIFGADTFDFRHCGAVTSLYSGPADRMPRATNAYLKRLHEFLEDAFIALLYHLGEDSIPQGKFENPDPLLAK